MNVQVLWNNEINVSFSSLYLAITDFMDDYLYHVDPLTCTKVILNLSM